MAKYSTGGAVSEHSGNQCEACGTESSSLSEATIEGATLFVCNTCSPHDDTATDETRDSSVTEADRQRDTVQKTTDENASLWQGDTSRWESDGAEYTDDQLPHLVSNYGDVVKQARSDADMAVADVATELGVHEETLLEVERGAAVRASVGGSVIEGLEALFDITLVVE
jgi:Predicted transcription factor, homolog of eukaryotic MBF1